MNLNQFLEERARRYGDKTAIVCGDWRLSYTELDRLSNKIANSLIRLGIGRGARVAILLPNGIEFVTAYFGIIKAGAIAVPLDTKYKTDELHSLFNSCQPGMLIAETDCLEQIIADARFGTIRQVIEVGHKYKGQFPSYDEIVSASPAAKIDIDFRPDDIAHIGYTSGPTSHPTGATVSHRTLIVEADISARALRQNERDVTMLFALPLHHVFGLVIGLLGTLSSGGKTVVLPGLSLGTLMELIEAERGTIFMGVPYVYVLMVRMAQQEGIKNDIRSLRVCISGGDSLPNEIARRFKRLYGMDLGQIWGLTEACASVTCTPVDGTWKLGSAGRAMAGWEMKIVDDYGMELPTGQPGEIIVRGPIMQDYYNNSEATARAIDNGWLHTGDIGKVDEDGDLFIVGRKKNMIIVKGQNVYPVDIEEVLQTHPQIAEVIAVGIPDELRGEVIGVIVHPKPGEVILDEEVKRFCRQRLSNYKVPKQVIFLDTLSKTAEGKVRRDCLQKLFADAALSRHQD